MHSFLHLWFLVCLFTGQDLNNQRGQSWFSLIYWLLLLSFHCKGNHCSFHCPLSLTNSKLNWLGKYSSRIETIDLALINKQSATWISYLALSLTRFVICGNLCLWVGCFHFTALTGRYWSVVAWSSYCRVTYRWMALALRARAAAFREDVNVWFWQLR